MGRRSTRVRESLSILRIGASKSPCLQIARQNLSFFGLQCVNFLFAGQGRASVPTRDYRAVETTAWLATGAFPISHPSGRRKPQALSYSFSYLLFEMYYPAHER